MRTTAVSSVAATVICIVPVSLLDAPGEEMNTSGAKVSVADICLAFATAASALTRPQPALSSLPAVPRSVAVENKALSNCAGASVGSAAMTSP